jgi:uncharacterized Tic20 family protein
MNDIQIAPEDRTLAAMTHLSGFRSWFWCALGPAAIALPIIGAVKANGGLYYKYPVVGATP